MMSEKTRVVMAGCGNICGAWMRDEVKERVEIVGFVDLQQDAAEKRREDFGYPDAVVGTDLVAVLEKTKPEAVFNLTVPEAHREVTLAALQHGCHVLSEKPLADSMESAREMVQAAEDADRIFAVIQNRRYNPHIRALTQFLRSGAIGDLTTVQSNFFLGAHFGGFRAEMLHVLLLDMAVHTFDAARLVTGANAEHVYCHEFNPAGSWFRHGAAAVAVFEMTGGLVYTYQGSWCAEGCPTTWESDWRIVGTGGTVLWDGGENFTVQRVTGVDGFKAELEELAVPVEVPEQKTGGHAGIILEFLDCVQSGGTPETTAADNIHSLGMVFGAIESAEAKARVAVKG
jgi:predicted dehydrogenase